MPMNQVILIVDPIRRSLQKLLLISYRCDFMCMLMSASDDSHHLRFLNHLELFARINIIGSTSVHNKTGEDLTIQLLCHS